MDSALVVALARAFLEGTVFLIDFRDGAVAAEAARDIALVNVRNEGHRTREHLRFSGKRRKKRGFED